MDGDRYEWEEREEDGMILAYPKIMSARRRDSDNKKPIEPASAPG